MQTKAVRDLFLDYFKARDHLVMPSFSLIPQNDPSLLLIGAGMAPLKPFFTGEKKPPHPRVATCQKCVRTPDIDRVGHTGRHATFFEMLGNFSFGDYFKEGAIAWAWDLVLNGYRLPEDRLWVSIYYEDDEAFKIWNEQIGVPAERIKRMGKEDNFWEIGLGPCGPCSEIYYDMGEAVGCDKPDCAVGCDCDRYLEIWNLVFTQFSREASGELIELEQKNIDTGAGLERLAMAMQDVSSFYDTDQVRPLFEHFRNLAHPAKRDLQVPLRIITEHSRGTTFLVADGVIPSNEGRGYVLRRLLRRAVRYGRLVGIEDSFMTDGVSMVVEQMGESYPQLRERQDYIRQVVGLEEKRFQETLVQGTEILEGYMEKLRREGESTLPGELAFKLNDTYGFPLDLTAEILDEANLSLDREGFDLYLRDQQSRARAAARTGVGTEESTRFRPVENVTTFFSGYDVLADEGEALLLLQEDEAVEIFTGSAGGEIVLDRTPFYAEAGGQVGDSGEIFGPGGRFRVETAFFTPSGQIVHRGRMVEGRLAKGEKLTARVDGSRRQGICRSHTATHLLHRALRSRLGDHVSQAGSLVNADRFRFDFNHFAPLEGEDLRAVEEDVNRMILESAKVQVAMTTVEEALAVGAAALFTERYSDGPVRMVSAGDYTSELCGGTHVNNTGEIGQFKIVGEESIGSGLRRIEALTGYEAYRRAVEKEDLLEKVAAAMNTTPGRLEQKAAEQVSENRLLQKTVRELRQRLASGESRELLSDLQDVAGVKVLSARVEADGFEDLRQMMDVVRGKLSSGVIVLGAAAGDKVFIVSSVSADLVRRGLKADGLVREVAAFVDGGGGGRAELAQAGGKNPAALGKALDAVERAVARQLTAAQ